MDRAIKVGAPIVGLIISRGEIRNRARANTEKKKA
jgi:hypothetical protein